MNRVHVLSKPMLPLLLLAITASSCRKFVDIGPPDGALPSSVLFTSDEGAKAAVAGLYSTMMGSNLTLTNGGITVYTALSSDELVNTVSNPAYDGFRTASLSAKECDVIGSRFWSHAYKMIYHANAVLEGLDGSTSLSERVRRALRGEMLTVRALHYFYLVNLFGDVPYLTTTDYTLNATHPRTPVARIYSALEADLQEAQSGLADSSPAPGKGRPNEWTATALLARIYLYQQKWAGAESAASSVINAGAYMLPPLSEVFEAASTEVIWRLERAGSNTAESATFIPPSSTERPALVLTPGLLGAFHSGDERKAAWVKEVSVGGQTYAYPYKYQGRSSATVTEYLTVLRLAELYLIRAEARARQGKYSEAALDLNTIRARAGLPMTTAADHSSLLAAIEMERQVELAFEWGHRWLDLKRTGRADDVLAPLKGTSWQSTDQLYPIPSAEIEKNGALSQNPGY